MKLFKLRSNPQYDRTTEYSSRLGSAITIKPNAKIAFKSIYINGSVRDYLVIENDQTFVLNSSETYSQNITIPKGTYTSSQLTRLITNMLNTSYYINLIPDDNNIYSPVICNPDGTDANQLTFSGIDWNCSLDRGNNYKCGISFNCNNNIISPVYKLYGLTNTDGVYSWNSTQPNFYDNAKYAITQLPISRGCNYVRYDILSLGNIGGNDITQFKAIMGIYNGSKRTVSNKVLSPADYDCCYTIRNKDLKVSVWIQGTQILLNPNVEVATGDRFYILSYGDRYKFMITNANGTTAKYSAGFPISQYTTTKIFTNDNIFSAIGINDKATTIGNIQTISSPYFSVSNDIVSVNYFPELSVNSSKVEGSATTVSINFGEPVNSQALQNLLGYLRSLLTINASSFTFVREDQVDRDLLEDVSVNLQNLDLSSYDTSQSVGFKTPTLMTIDSLEQTVSAAGAFAYDVPTPVFIEMNNTVPISLSSFLVRITSQNIPIDIPSGVCSITVLIDDSGK